MLDVDKAQNEAPILSHSNDLTLSELLDALASHKDKPLVFTYDGQAVKPGYHVTEVKAGRFDAIDCGANPESWSELFIQLWDVDGDGPHMSAGKFSSIIGKVSERIAVDPMARMTFEVSDGFRPMQLHKADAPQLDDGKIQVALKPRTASCKPLDRAFQAASEEKACCGSAATGTKCCG